MCKIKVERKQLYLEANIVKMGNDLLVAVSGGDKPHIGCASVSVPRPSSCNPTGISATTSTINLPGHKDDVIANYIADVLCKKLNVPVVVVCGVHVEKISQEEIEIFNQLATTLANKILISLER